MHEVYSFDKCLTFYSGNSKRLTGSDIHYEGDGGKGKEQNYGFESMHVSARVLIRLIWELLNTPPLCTTIVFVGRRSLKNEAEHNRCYSCSMTCK